MTAQLIDGNALAQQVRTEVAGRVAALKARGLQPQLNVILVGEDHVVNTELRFPDVGAPSPARLCSTTSKRAAGRG